MSPLTGRTSSQPCVMILQVYSECPSFDELVPALLAHPLEELQQVGCCWCIISWRGEAAVQS